MGDADGANGDPAPGGEGEGTEEPASLADSPSWRRLQTEVLSGVRHEVLGRLSALRSLIQIGRLGRYSTDDLITMLEEETDRLERPAEWLRTLPDDQDGAPEPVGVRDLLDDLAGLATAVAESEELEVRLVGDEDWPPVRASYGELARCLLSVLVGIGGRSAAVRVSAERNGEGRLGLAVEAVGGAGATGGGDASEGFPLGRGDEDGELRARPELRAALERLGGDIAVESPAGSPPRCELLLPTSSS